ncbi:hypothetical protein BT96DRAFT_1025184 [Gymnopus androsaceus JB14]|uniref:Uncharacterized protein n=1 Tax=Gymnopus androsaceus JB14 TaxID=1447944 RepID=A0A6A4GTT3_9AGAR|nr:hypothetical protein BT96DRAFT_1025184 [Gymnopus androsaceus JB14]
MTVLSIGPPSGSHSLLPEPTSTSPGTAPEPSALFPVAGWNLTTVSGISPSSSAYPGSPCMVNMPFLTIPSKNPSTAPAFTADVTPSFDGFEPLTSSAAFNASSSVRKKMGKTLKSARRGIPQLVGRLSAPGDFDFLDLICIFVEEHELACLESEDLGAVFEGGELDGVDEGADEEDIQPRLTKTATSSSNAQLYCTTPLPIPSKSTLELQAQPSTSSPASTLLPVSSASSAPHVSAFLGSLSHSPASVLMSTARADAEPAQTAGNKYKNGQKHEKQRAKRAKDRVTQEGPSAATLSHVLSPETAVEVELDAVRSVSRGVAGRV